MENPNIYTDFKPFILGEDKYHVKIRYKFTIDLTDFQLVETIDKYKIYTCPTMGYVYVVSDLEEFNGLASIINFV
jgi:hypothetical protein